MPSEQGTLLAVLLFGFGTAVAMGAHVGLKAAQRRARKAYRELVGKKHEPPEDEWEGIRTLTGGWGCLSAVLEFLRGLGVVLAGAAVIYLVASR